ncbi:GTP cyclohydrolase I FolE [Rathayibacter iranicus]|uniref:GTP cyclohydrolase 1 n=2 Tax=Rathayibacter iranicus TaxID=59737 RepID=A0AAD1AID8_9MICO|nr:GTP cyclohydrolase I FolE [Rathayibacter iranicus]AZZ56966.1 GTP cyclohydrolase I FolE [Rathayibacter iranicus]MWV29571.1 GTP cyclohydrolase I FolE [Rathayibacter iranicus NCPPB 2253 = VKM Ac-1602]PPI41890.1 GTP cyclohydrolase I FolE [Rathayibacter iranicus]PPI57630.1 GTP cyclohydrolase I FolE [Rathayibacter iranicus]PPI68610.1 GTP cyclohydrolase I FolE [Rathayibacter iranicus]
MPVDKARIEAAVTEILAAIGENPGREGLVATPRRVAAAYEEFFTDFDTDAAAQLTETFAVVEDGQEAPLQQTIIVRDLVFRSVCEHHLLPFVGVVHIAYRPQERVVGLGRLPRVVDTVASRPQIQERLTEQIADALDDGLAPEGVLVVVDAEHGCVRMRGPRQAASSTVTVAARGSLAETAARAEIIALIGAARGR